MSRATILIDTERQQIDIVDNDLGDRMDAMLGGTAKDFSSMKENRAVHIAETLILENQDRIKELMNTDLDTLLQMSLSRLRKMVEEEGKA